MSLSKLLFFLCIPLFLRANSDAIFNNDEDLSLFHHVNVITGDLNLCMQDALINGAASLPIIRTYSSAGALERLEEYDTQFGSEIDTLCLRMGWKALPNMVMLASGGGSIKDTKFYLHEKNGTLITYVFDRTVKHETYIFKAEQGAAHYSGILSARNNPKNNWIRYEPLNNRAYVYLPNGGSWHYHGCLTDENRSLKLVAEIAPNQHCTLYHRKKDNHLLISLKNPSKTLDFATAVFHVKEHEGKGFNVHLSTSDQQQVHYRSMRFEEDFYLNSVKSNVRPHEKIGFTPSRKGLGARIKDFTLGEAHQFRVHYYQPPDSKTATKWLLHPKKKDLRCDRVSMIEAPIGKNGEMLPLATFAYAGRHTDVRDISQRLIRYHHDGKKLTEIHYFDDKDQLSSILRFVWEGSFLKAKVFLKNQNEALFSKTFQYDAAGNVIQETFWGNLTTKIQETFAMQPDGSLKDAQSYYKRFSYLPKFNVALTEEEEGGPSYRYRYKPNTDLLEAQFTCDKDKILLRRFCFYNEDNLLIREIADDGCTENADDITDVTERHITRHTLDPNNGMVICTQENYLNYIDQEQQLKRTLFRYSPQKRVIEEQIYDENDVYRYTLYTDYNAQGRVISKTTPLGRRNTYNYDQFGNLIEVKEVGSLKKTHTYFPFGLPHTTTEWDGNGEGRVSVTEYDSKGRLCSIKDTKNRVILQNHDCFGHCTETTFLHQVTNSEVHPTTRFTYDLQGNLASTTSPRHETITTTYNSLRKPVSICHPDGAMQYHEYFKNGQVAKTILADATEVHYTYDVLQRMTSKKTFSPSHELLAEESWVYNALHLLSHTDEKGLTTTFCYDRAGRKTTEHAKGRAKFFTYDALNFLQIVSDTTIAHFTFHNEEGYITEQYTQDGMVRIENRMQFFYDEENRKVKAIRTTAQGPATDEFFYDAQGRLSRHKDPLGYSTEFLFNDNYPHEKGVGVFQKTTVNPEGNQTIETFDTLDRLSRIEKKDVFGNTVALEELFYDDVGNCSQKLSTVYEKSTPTKKQAIFWEHDSYGRIIKETQSQKVTTFTYDLRGNLIQKTLPSGILLYYSYDGLNRLLRSWSSDGTIDYEYAYERGSNPTWIKDHVHQLELSRTYNSFGEIVEEKGPFNLHYRWDYDDSGRCRTFTLPDHSQICYDYSGFHLCSVGRQSPHGSYKHRYTQFDPNGHVQKEEQILNLGTIHTTHDLLERPFMQNAPAMNHNIAFGPSGLVVHTSNSILGDKLFQYDALDQLVIESDHHYAFNSLGNPINAVVDDCNQLLALDNLTLAYDRDGNPLHKTSSEKQVHYTYDALGRLTAIKEEDVTTRFLYDPLSRLIAKEVQTQSRTDRALYLYDKEFEIGACDSQGHITQLKVLGLGIKGDIGAAIALELNGKIYAPLHDFTGHIVAIVSANGELAEYYPMNVYGKEELSFTPLNPWRFCSKRNEAGLVYFGKRFYDPALGRWLTPDPAGFSDGPNLYLYVLNNPLNRLDLFGLNSDQLFWGIDGKDIPNIDVPIRDLEAIRESKDILVCKGSIGEVTVDWVISCGHWHKLCYTEEEEKSGKVNIWNHVHELVPKEGMIIGIVTAQNGIQTTLPEFKSMSKTIIDNIPESPLFIGLHNPSTSILGDIKRVCNERQGKETPTVARTRQFMEAILDGIPHLNPQLLWTHISHSEGGLIGQCAINGMNPEKKQQLREHLISLSLGPALPISKSNTLKAVNVYSDKDYVTKWFASSFLQDPNYDIKMVNCISPPSERNFRIADHKFEGSTYQKALKDKIGDNRREYGFYNGQTR